MNICGTTSLEWEMLQTKLTQNIKTHILCSITCFPKIVPLWGNVTKCRTSQATDGNIIWHMCFAWWITKATQTHTHAHTHTQYTILIPFPQQQWLYKHALMLFYMYSTVLLIPFVCTTNHHSCSSILAIYSWVSFIMTRIQWLLPTALLLRKELHPHVYIHSSKILQISHILTYFA
jgi:hypothetical protein